MTITMEAATAESGAVANAYGNGDGFGIVTK